jgi:hypothetical protein
MPSEQDFIDAGFAAKEKGSTHSKSAGQITFPVEVYSDLGERETVRVKKVLVNNVEYMQAVTDEHAGRWFQRRPSGLGVYEVEAPTDN